MMTLQPLHDADAIVADAELDMWKRAKLDRPSFSVRVYCLTMPQP
jgi:hypothetical protein